MRRVFTKRICKCLVLLALIALALPGASPRANTHSAGLSPLWDAPLGPGQSDDASRWLSSLRDSMALPRAGCQKLLLPELSLTRPARAFQIRVEREQFTASPIIYLQEPIAEFFIVVATDANGCPWLSISGRGVPFAQRDFISPFPYARLPALPEGATITAIVQDYKAIRPWILLADETTFGRDNTLLWVGLGTYSGILLVMIVVAFGFDAYARSRVAVAYALYGVALQVWLVQNFGIGSALLPFWPGPQYFPILQAISVAGVVLGVGFAVLEFLQLRGRLRVAIGVATLGSALCFLGSAWHVAGYRAGSAVLFVLAVATLALLVRGVFRGGDASIRLFTLGLGATMVGGGVQAFSVIGSAVDVNRLAVFAFPIGSLLQAAFWLMALIVRLRGEQRELLELEGQQAAIMWAMPDLILVIDRRGVCLDYKQTYTTRSFVAGNELLGKNLSAVLPTETAASMRKGIEQALQLGDLQSVFVELPVEGSVHHYEARIAPNGPNKVVIVVRDITPQKRDEEKIRRLAYVDTLTGLPNRQSFLERLDHELLRARRTRHRMALLFLDLDGFKRINDTLGHSAGDCLLQTIAGRLQEKLRAGAFISRPALDPSGMHFARLGGDEFTVVLPDVDSAEAVGVVAQRLQGLLGQPLLIGEQEVAVTSSIGIALFPDDGEDAATLLKHADTAMYYAKERGRNNWQLYERTLTTRTTVRLALEGDLRKALERGEFRLYYQPQVRASNATVVGIEALIRWQHPQHGLVLPAQFIPVAEESGLVVPIGEWVLNAACSQVREWQQKGVSVPRVAVNVSARQLSAPDFLDTVAAIIDATGVRANLLELELTESILMDPDAKRIKGLYGLRALGMHFSIDDFGTGYSSLSYIKRFPIGTLKIDQSFIRGLPQGADDAGITTAIIAMARSLDLDVVAEGVETREQLHFLQRAQCPKLQGNLFSRPLPPDEMEALLRRGHNALFSLVAAEQGKLQRK